MELNYMIMARPFMTFAFAIYWLLSVWAYCFKNIQTLPSCSARGAFANSLSIFHFSTTGSFVFLPAFAILSQILKAKHFKAFQDESDTFEVILHFWRTDSLFFWCWRGCLGWYVLNCSHGEVSAMDLMLQLKKNNLSNACPRGSIIEKVFVSEE